MNTMNRCTNTVKFLLNEQIDMLVHDVASSLLQWLRFYVKIIDMILNILFMIK